MPTLEHELRTKVVLPDHQLYVLGCEAYRVGRLGDAAHELVRQIGGSESLLRALARHYLATRIAPDMEGASRSVRGGHAAIADGQNTDAASRGPVEGGGGHVPNASAIQGLPSPPSPSDVAGAKCPVLSSHRQTAPAASPHDPAGATIHLPSGHADGAPAGSPVESGGAMMLLPSGPSRDAPSLSPHDADEASSSVPSGQGTIASPASPVRDGTGQHRVDLHTANARPVTKPNPARQGVSASIQSTIAKGLMQRTKTSDGRPWAVVGYHELDGMDRDGVVARLIKRSIAPPIDRFARVEHLITEKKFSQILGKARELNHVA